MKLPMIRKNLTLSGEFNRNMSDKIANLNFGAEYWVRDIFAPRIGYKVLADIGGLSTGLGFKWKIFQMDYAWTSSGALGSSHRMSLTAKFGTRGETTRKKKPKAKLETKVIIPKKKSEERLNIAVADLVPKNVSAMDAAIVSDFIRTELVRTQVFKVLDRQNMERVLEEQKFQATGCTSEECAVQMGKILNVQCMVVGTFSKFLETYYVNVSFVSVETGEILGAESAECASGRELPGAAKKIATSFAGQFGR